MLFLPPDITGVPFDTTRRLCAEVRAGAERAPGDHRAQLIHRDDTTCWLYVMEWEREDDDALIGKLKQIQGRVWSGFLPLVSVKHQVLPYFGQTTTWTDATRLRVTQYMAVDHKRRDAYLVEFLQVRRTPITSQTTLSSRVPPRRCHRGVHIDFLETLARFRPGDVHA